MHAAAKALQVKACQAVPKALPLLGGADYRAYLARGVLLGSDGRKADAQRMFLQARPHLLNVAATCSGSGMYA